MKRWRRVKKLFMCIEVAGKCRRCDLRCYCEGCGCLAPTMWVARAYFRLCYHTRPM